MSQITLQDLRKLRQAYVDAGSPSEHSHEWRCLSLAAINYVIDALDAKVAPVAPPPSQNALAIARMLVTTELSDGQLRTVVSTHFLQLIGKSTSYENAVENLAQVFDSARATDAEPPMIPGPQGVQNWAILELMGHVQTAGLISEFEAFGAKMGRIDIPREDGTFATQYFGGASVYRITWVTEEIARRVATTQGASPVHTWELRDMLPEERPKARPAPRQPDYRCFSAIQDEGEEEFREEQFAAEAEPYEPTVDEILDRR